MHRFLQAFRRKPGAGVPEIKVGTASARVPASVFSDGFLGQFAEEGQGVGFVVGGFHHHEDGHAEEDGLNDGVEVKTGDALQEGPQDLIVEEPGDEQVEPLEAMEADEAITTEAAAGQDDDGRNPADAGDVTEDGGGAGIDSGQRIRRGG